MTNLSQINSRMRVVDPSTGKPSMEFLRFLGALYRRVGGMDGVLAELTVTGEVRLNTERGRTLIGSPVDDETSQLQVGGAIRGFSLASDGTITAQGNISGYRVSAAEDLRATANVTAGGDVAALGDVSGSTLTAAGNASVGQDLTVGGSLQAESLQVDSLDVLGSLTATGALTAQTVTAVGDVSAGGDVSANGDVTAEGAVSGATLVAVSDVTAGGNIEAQGEVAGQTLDVSGEASVGGALAVAGSVTVAEDLSISGAVSAQSVESEAGYAVDGVQVVGARVPGWAAPVGTVARGAYSVYAGQTISATYDPVQIQALDDAVAELSAVVAALIVDLRAHGLIGATP